MPDPAASSPAPSPVVRGGTITFGVLGEPATLDPYAARASDLTRALIRPVYRSLYRVDPTGEPRADLVESVATGEAGAHILLRDALWSNGRAIRASDVVQSIERAREAGVVPSRIVGVTAVDRGVDITATGTIGGARWREILSRVIVLPGGRFERSAASGPFRISQRTPGLEVVYRPNGNWDGPPPLLDRLEVVSVVSLDGLIGLLERGRLDAAALPSAVNLDERLREIDVRGIGVLGDEGVEVDLAGTTMSTDERIFVAKALDRRMLEQGFVRAAGRLAELRLPPGPGTRPIGTLRLAAPIGDELLMLVQRVMREQLKTAGVSVELVNADVRTHYGQWAEEDPFDMVLRRSYGGPAAGGSGPLGSIPLFRVESVIAHERDVIGLQPNPTFEGPLWNAEKWSVGR